jgi:Polyketide cyclase / dehydrase and lipid transport
MQSYDVQDVSSAPPSVVWSALLDSASWTSWTPMDELVTAKSTSGVAQVGTLRTFRTGSVVATERVTGLEPLRRMDYEGVENPQLRDYQASIELDQTPAGGTAVRWPVR